MVLKWAVCAEWRHGRKVAQVTSGRYKWAWRAVGAVDTVMGGKRRKLQGYLMKGRSCKQ
jgi:hypothetical protein